MPAPATIESVEIISTCHCERIDESCRGHNIIHADVMRFSRDSLDELFIKCDSTFDADNVGEQAIVVTLPAPEPVPSRVECYSRNQHQVQTVCRKFGAGCGGFGDAETANGAVAVGIGNFKWSVSLG